MTEKSSLPNIVVEQSDNQAPHAWFAHGRLGCGQCELLLDYQSESETGRDGETKRSFSNRVSQEIGELPKLMKKPLIDLRVSLHEPQSASQNATKENEGLEDMNRACPGCFLMYCKTLKAALK
ncbi:uncharacterized protein LOC132036172 [Lycium ferocissimum]|uniref:uncharacterized protein LOC132036172 n=1 Tax=Lycium ferocissimum TaxID=112874 RepID=UPI002815BAA8|nr:uncharacterized protein LOC132036172 [Lycium ferocissimum]